MTQGEEALRKARAAIEQAKKTISDKRNEEDRKFIVANIGKDLISILTPLLQNMVANSAWTREQMKEVISQIKVESPKVSVEAPSVKVDAPKIPDIAVPKIEFPKKELISAMREAIKGIKFPDIKVPDFPKEMKVTKVEELIKQVKKLADAKMTVELSSGKFSAENPLPVILTDEDGKFYKALASLIASGGGRGVGSMQFTDEGYLRVDITDSSIAVTQATHDNLNANANLQISDSDASASNPVPVRPNEYELAGNTNHVKKYYTNAGAVTDGIIWSPAAGKRWYVTDIFINVSTDATVTLEDDLAGGDDPVWKAELAGNSGWSHAFTTPLYSGEDAADLTITTSAGNVYVMVTGYEV